MVTKGAPRAARRPRPRGRSGRRIWRIWEDCNRGL